MTPQAAQSNSLDPVPTIPPAAPENMPARQHHAESAGPLATEETARVEASRVADEARRRAELRAAVVRSAAARRAGETVEPTDPEEPYYRPRWS
ncbi:hypothetical protein [Nocardia sp. alder85J]|uniref:hypothetical protein n=1 Tax=Nocardia sp. alder85J TaxID=2862949 RepID=UPI001CD58E1B|nr:hypothetical protein [Nocardia sp. alder85J]MCX4096217.1 hypothetical protein [Nocardia sp. alder85J]